MAHPGGMGFDYIASAHLLPSCGFFCVALNVEHLFFFFFVDPRHFFLIDGCSAVNCNFGVLVEKR